MPVIPDVGAARAAAAVMPPCAGCRHPDAEHLFDLGSFKLCLEIGCSCGRRALAGLGWALLPWLPTAAAAIYLAYHLHRWKAVGFLVVG